MHHGVCVPAACLLAGVGLDSVLALRLLQRLLFWDPAGRPSASEALRHAYFSVEQAGGAAGGPEGQAGLLKCGKPGGDGWC